MPGGGGWGRIGGASVEGSSPLSTALTSVTRVTRRDCGHTLSFYRSAHFLYTVLRLSHVNRLRASLRGLSERPLADRVW